MDAQTYADWVARPHKMSRLLASLRAAEVGKVSSIDASASMEKNEPGWVPRVRLEPPPPRPSLRAQGVVLCTRERRERDMQHQLIEASQQAQAELHASIAEAEEVARQIEEGVLLPDGTPAVVKRKRPTTSIGRAIAAEEKAQMLKAAAAAAAEAGGSSETTGAGSKRKSPGPGEEGDGAGAKAAKAAKEKKEKTPKEPKEPKPEKPKKPKKIAPGTGFEPGMLVEVSLRLGEAFANWYEAKLVEPGQGTKWRLQLVRQRDEEDEEEPADGSDYAPLRLQGRKEFETATAVNIRPPPPQEPEWQPSVGNECELFFEDGWWKVDVQEDAGNGEWTVMYAPAQAVHTVPRDLLRPIATWVVDTQSYEPLKIQRR